jgi:hypothetical protein
MTAGLIMVMRMEIVAVADTRCLDEAGAQIVGAKKIFLHGEKAAIFSWGCGPCDVQQKVEALDPHEARPEHVAQALLAAFPVVSPGHSFGLFVAGFDGSQLSLWHVDRPTPDHGVAVQNRTLQGGRVDPPGTAEQLDIWLASHQDIADLVQLGVGFVRRASELAPAVVSADATIIRVTAGGAEWVASPA